jgi:hydrogenase/urease accessory protein HupE
VLLATSAAAHLGDLSYSEVVVHGAAVDYKLRFAAHLIPGVDPSGEVKLTRRDILAREPDILEWLSATLRVRLDGAECSPELAESYGPDANDDLTVILVYTCQRAGHALKIEFHPFDEVLPEFQNLASVRHAGKAAAFVFTPQSRVLVIGADGVATEESQSPTLLGFFVLGVEHIWTGYDHLLFLLALLLPGGTLWRLAGIVTAFTIAHSITLGLAALDVLTLPIEPVEAAIAASVVVAALDGMRPHVRDHRWLLTFAFGLIHGFGFAGVLREIGLPADAVAMPLLGFNLGVEAGQLAVVAVAVPTIRAVARSAGGARVKTVLGVLIAAIGAFWLVERLSAWLL